MTTQTWKKWAVGASLLGSVSAVLVGCDGDDNDGGPATPVPISTATRVPTTAPTASPTTVSVPVALPNGQSATLNLRAQGSTLTGNLMVGAVLPGVARARQAQVGFVIPPGTYLISGTVTPPRSFRGNGVIPAPVGAFTVSGQFPTATQAGSFTITVGGRTISGTIPAFSTQPTPSPTTSATAQPTAQATAQPTGGPTPAPTTSINAFYPGTYRVDVSVALTNPPTTGSFTFQVLQNGNIAGSNITIPGVGTRAIVGAISPNGVLNATVADPIAGTITFATTLRNNGGQVSGSGNIVGITVPVIGTFTATKQ